MSQPTQTVLVTGAAGNVGRAVVALLAERGASIVAVDRGTDELSGILSAVASPSRHRAEQGVDLSAPEACRQVVARVVALSGGIDGVVHTVGGFAAAPIADAGAELWERMFRLNLITTVNLFQAAIAAMRERGRGSLVAIGAGAGLRGMASLGPYSAAKSGVLRLVESYAAEVKGDGVRVNAVLPGTIDTPQNRAAMPGEDRSRWVTTRQLAETIAFLLSDAASGVTGALLPVMGRG